MIRNCRLTNARAAVLCASVLVLLLQTGCSNTGDPFSYVKVSGTVTYDDGSKIPGEFQLMFHPEAPTVGNMHPKAGKVTVDKDGRFQDVTSHTYADGIAGGKHKVTLIGGSGSKLPESIVPPEYYDVQKTPLEVDTTNSASFTLKVHNPKGGASKSAPSPSPLAR